MLYLLELIQGLSSDCAKLNPFKWTTKVDNT